MVGQPAVAEQSGRGTVEFTIAGIRAAQRGVLIVALYDRETAWLQLDSARAVLRLPVAAESLSVSFNALPYDSIYAVAVIHDRNGNGKMDMRWFPYPKPKEGGGISNNHVRTGPPEYDRARFAVTGANEHFRIQMRY